MRNEDYKNNDVKEEDYAIIQKNTFNQNKIDISKDHDLPIRLPQAKFSGSTLFVDGDLTTTDTLSTKIVKGDEQQEATTEMQMKHDVFPKIDHTSFIQRKNIIDQKRNEILKFAESLRGDFQKAQSEISSSNHSYSHNNDNDGCGSNAKTTKRQLPNNKSSFLSSFDSLSSFYDDDDDDDDDTSSITRSYDDYSHDDDDHTTISNMLENFLLSSSMTLKDIHTTTTDDDNDTDSFDESLANFFADSFSFSGSDNEGHTATDDEDDEKDADSFVLLDIQSKMIPNPRTYGLDNVLNTIIDDVIPHVIHNNNEVRRAVVRSTS